MVLLHLARCHRYLWRGLRDRAHVSRILSGAAPLPADGLATSVVPAKVVRAVAAAEAAASGAAALSRPPRPPAPRWVWPWQLQLPDDPAFGHFIAQPVTMPVYCGLRMIDENRHVNNAKYLEIFEFARWHQIAFLGMGRLMLRHRIAFVVSDLSITYQREIGPCRTVWVRTRTLLPPAGSDPRRLFVEHEVWSKDGQKLHASCTLGVALIGPVEYAAELKRRYAPDAAAPAAPPSAKAGTRRTVTLECEHVMADAAGLSSVAELRALFKSVEHVCTPVVDERDAAAVAEAATTGAVHDVDGEEREERIRTLAQVWRNTRSRLRHKTLLPHPPHVSTQTAPSEPSARHTGATDTSTR